MKRILKLCLSIPAGSFEKKGFWWLSHYRFKGKIEGVGHIHMHLNLTLCKWWINIFGAEASSLIDSRGTTVELTAGNNTGSDKFDWTKKKEWSIARFTIEPSFCERFPGPKKMVMPSALEKLFRAPPLSRFLSEGILCRLRFAYLGRDNALTRIK